MAATRKRVTIKHVAEQAGVSYQTVSRVINGSETVTDATRHKVQQAITALNFRPNLAARSLSSRYSYLISLIIPYPADYLITDPHILAQISGIDTVAYQYGYALLLATAGASRNGVDAYHNYLRHEVADGAIIVETASCATGHILLQEQRNPYVTMGYDRHHPTARMVHCDDYAGGKAATNHLLAQGHRRIGVINGPPSGAVISMQERLRGHRRALSEAGLAFDEELLVYGDYTRRGGQAATEKLLAHPSPPTAIFALNDRMAMGAIRALHAAGRCVPEDVAVIGFDDVPAAADFSPALTTVRQPSKALGQAAAKMLFAAIKGEAVSTTEVVLPAPLVLRQSA